jgi:hypothetical protein
MSLAISESLGFFVTTFIAEYPFSLFAQLPPVCKAVAIDLRVILGNVEV